MAVTKADKATELDQLETAFKGSDSAILLDFKGLNVPKVTELRRQLRTVKASYRVVKNTLALRAIDSKSLEALKEHFVGPTAVVFGSDPVALAKALTDFAKDVPAVQFKAGMVEGRAIAAEQIKDIASLPSRNELIAKLLFLLQSPITRFARVLAAVPQSFVMVLDQIRQKREEQA